MRNIEIGANTQLLMLSGKLIIEELKKVSPEVYEEFLQRFTKSVSNNEPASEMKRLEAEEYLESRIALLRDVGKMQSEEKIIAKAKLLLSQYEV